MQFRKTLGFLFSSNVLVAVLSVFLGVATARILGVEGRGEFYLFVQTVSLGTTFLAFGLQSSFQYFLSKQIMPKSDIIGMIILQLAFSTIILSVALALTKTYLVQWFSIDDDFLYAAFICVVLGISVLFFNSVMMTFSRGVKWTSILAVVSSALQLVLFLIFVCHSEWCSIFVSPYASHKGRIPKRIDMMYIPSGVSPRFDISHPILIAIQLTRFYTPTFELSFYTISHGAILLIPYV